MDFAKIKDFLLKNKNYLLVACILLGLFFWSKQGTQNEPAKVDRNSSSLIAVKNKEKVAGKTTSTTVTCDISGAVQHQGVYTLKTGARLDDLIAAAGGVRKNVQLKAVNRALILKDQDKIYIPYKGEKAAAATTVSSAAATANSTSGSSSDKEKINLNTASVTDLQKLSGIGQKKAERIIEYREKSGQFKKIEDLKQVSGIGDKTFAALKGQLEV